MNAVGGGRQLEGDVLECILPIPAAGYKFNTGSYVTFGGPNPLYIESTVPDPNYGTPAYYTATFGGVGFAYGLYNATTDSLRYIPLVGSPVSSFKITLARPQISNVSVYGQIVDNMLQVLEMAGGNGQVTVGMIFPVQGLLTVACTVIAYGSGTGGVGTYQLARNSGSGNVNMDAGTISTTTVANSGDVILSNSMTPSDGIARFGIYTNFTYDPVVPV